MKKVLIITYYWPPAGGPGVQRVLKFAKYLPDYNWQPIILTVEKGNYPSIDEDLVKEIPFNCKVYRTKIFEPFEIYKSLIGKKSDDKIPTFVLSKTKNEKLIDKIIKWVRANLFIPDAKIGWKFFMIQTGMKIIQNEKPDVIFSSSPPHSLQIGAMILAQKSNLPWIADFRDPWTNAFWQSDIKRIPIAKKKDKSLENKVISSCDALITVSDSIKNDFIKIRSNNCFTITNGFDEVDFKVVKNKNAKFTIRYTGTLGRDQQIQSLLKSLEKIPVKIIDNIIIEFFGSFHSTITEQIFSSPFKYLFTLHESVSHSKSVELISNADLLLLIIPNTKNNEGIVTGKIFEYLATKNPILGFGPKNGDASDILLKTGCGKMFEHNSDASDFIIEQYKMWELNIPFFPNENVIKSFSRKMLTKDLAEVLGKFSCN